MSLRGTSTLPKYHGPAIVVRYYIELNSIKSKRFESYPNVRNWIKKSYEIVLNCIVFNPIKTYRIVKNCINSIWIESYNIESYQIILNCIKIVSNHIELYEIVLSGSVWLRQPVEDLRFDLGILFYGFTRWSWTIPTLRKSPFVIWALLAPCAAVLVR